MNTSQGRVNKTAKNEHEFECPRCGHCCREWVGLTDEELFGLTDEMYSFARHIEAKLKEKNT